MRSGCKAGSSTGPCQASRTAEIKNLSSLTKPHCSKVKQTQVPIVLQEVTDIAPDAVWLQGRQLHRALSGVQHRWVPVRDQQDRRAAIQVCLQPSLSWVIGISLFIKMPS